MYTSRDERQFRLEFFNGKAYEVARIGTGEAFREEARAGTDKRPWRLTLVDKARNLIPRYRKPAGGRTGYNRSIDEVQEAYLQWAASKGLNTISLYVGQIIKSKYLPGQFAINRVDYADTFGPAVNEAADALVCLVDGGKTIEARI